jgi:hypothetical protein
MALNRGVQPSPFCKYTGRVLVDIWRRLNITSNRGRKPVPLTNELNINHNGTSWFDRIKDIIRPTSKLKIIQAQNTP